MYPHTHFIGERDLFFQSVMTAIPIILELIVYDTIKYEISEKCQVEAGSRGKPRKD